MTEPFFDDSSERVRVDESDSTEHNLQQYCVLFGCNETTAIEQWAWFEENRALNEGSVHRNAFLTALRKIKETFACIAGFKGNRAMAVECAALAWQCGHVFGVRSQVDIAENWKCTRANVEKIVGAFQAKCELPPIPGQREEAQRDNMSTARIGQLKKD